MLNHDQSHCDLGSCRKDSLHLHHILWQKKYEVNICGKDVMQYEHLYSLSVIHKSAVTYGRFYYGFV